MWCRHDELLIHVCNFTGVKCEEHGFPEELFPENKRLLSRLSKTMAFSEEGWEKGAVIQSTFPGNSRLTKCSTNPLMLAVRAPLTQGPGMIR